MTYSHQNRADILQERFALKATSYLSTGTADLPHDVSERLRVARMQAVAKRKITKTQTAGNAVNMGGSAAMTWGSSDGLGWWGRIGSVMPLIALVVGMLTINSVQNDNRAQEVAEVDAALLTDDLPPAAFSDPGFVQFLKTNR
ncbi:MAG: DUF3619 family protein [Polaromonas sp.]|nr:DUF3619 family protein [Polaromonas sp.]